VCADDASPALHTCTVHNQRRRAWEGTVPVQIACTGPALQIALSNRHEDDNSVSGAGSRERRVIPNPDTPLSRLGCGAGACPDRVVHRVLVVHSAGQRISFFDDSACLIMKKYVSDRSRWNIPPILESRRVVVTGSRSLQ
jgi:hypothetical protein